MKLAKLLILLAFVLTACMPSSPVIQIPVTPLSSTTSLPEPTGTESPLPPQTELPNAAPVTSIIYGLNSSDSFLLLGGIQNGSWASAEMIAPALRGGESYGLYTLGGPVNTTLGGVPVFSPICKSNSITVDSISGSGDLLGISGASSAMPRVAQEIATDNETYRQAVLDLLIAQGIKQPQVDVSRILRVDIERDGIDEILISASYFADESGHDVAAGDYSLVVLRTLVNNTVVTIPLFADYYLFSKELAFPYTYTIAGVLDVNGDDQLEVVVGIKRWEGYGAAVYEIDSAKAITERALIAVCQP